MVIVVEGNIGAGKTLLAKAIAKELGIDFYAELSDSRTEALLSRFYDDMGRWAFPLQVHFLNQRFDKIKAIFRGGGGVLDRSIYGDAIFADVLHGDGHMDTSLYREYKELLNNMLEHSGKPSLLIYLRCTPEISQRRIAQRDRKYEHDIDVEYLRRLHERYEWWFYEYSLSPKISLDTERYPLDNPGNMGRMLDMVREKLDNNLTDQTGEVEQELPERLLYELYMSPELHDTGAIGRIEERVATWLRGKGYTV